MPRTTRVPEAVLPELDYKQAPQLIFEAIKVGNKEQVAELIRRFQGLNLEHTDSMGNTALNIAVQCGNEFITEMLLKKGAYVNT